MAQMAAEDTSKAFLEKLTNFPCTFNLDLGRKIKNNRFRSIRHNLGNELKNEANDIKEEIIRKKNMLTWALFHLDEDEDAVELNSEVVKQTDYSNIPSLGNRAFIMWRRGDEQEANNCLQQLELLKNRPDFDDLQTEAIAEQAYYHTRMGGIHSIQMCIKLFKRVVEKQPRNYEWKFGLGLTCRRATDPNVYCSFTEPWDVEYLIKTAAECLFDVGENGDFKTRGLSYAQLAVMKDYYPDEEYNELFQHKDIFQLCGKALEYGSDIAAVLTHCGRSLKHYDVDEAIKLLERSKGMRANSTNCHHLGLSYERKATLIATEEPKEEAHEVIKSCPSISRLKLQVQRAIGDEMTDASPLSINDDLVKKAIECYREAEKVSHQQNLPASFNLGFIYKRTGQMEKAVQQFNKVTNSPFAGTGNRVAVINAYEQAGLCLLKLSENGEKEKALYYEDGKKKLTQAIGLAAGIASILPELKTCTQEVWKSFRTLEEDLNREGSPLGKNKDLLRLLSLVQDHGRTVRVVRNILEMSDPQLDDLDIIKPGIESYLKLRQFENALAFLRLASLRPALTESVKWKEDDMTRLRSKVMLSTIFERLCNKSDTTKDLFQKAFELKYGKCFGGVVEETSVKSPNSEIEGDVLILYDDSKDTKESYSTTSQMASSLQNIFYSVFGLLTSKNLEDCSDYNDSPMELQLQEIKKYQVVIIFCDEENRSKTFDFIIKAIPPQDFPNTTMLVVKMSTENSDVDRRPELAERDSEEETSRKTTQAESPMADTSLPLGLRGYRHLNLRDIGWLSELDNSLTTRRDAPSIEEIIQKVFGGNSMSLLKLFEFVIDNNVSDDFRGT